MIRKKKRQFRLLHALLLLSFLGTGGFVLLASTVLTRIATVSFEQQVERHLDQALSTAWLTMGQTLSNIRLPLLLLSQSPDLAKHIDRDDRILVEHSLSQMYKTQNNIVYDLLFIIRPSEGIWANQSSMVTTSSQQLKAIEERLSSRKEHSSEFFLEGSNQSYLMVSIPIDQTDARLYGGVLLTGSDLSLSQVRLNSHATCAYFVTNNLFLAMAGSSDICREYQAVVGPLKRWHHHEQDGTLVIRGPSTDDFRLPKLDLVLLYPQEAVQNIQDQIFRELGLISLGFLLIIVLFVWVGKALIGRSVDGLVHYAHADHQSQIVEQPQTYLSEFDQITQAFTGMVDRVREELFARSMIETKLRDLNAELEQRVEHRTQELSNVNTLLQAAKDEAVNASTAKGDFLAMMSHEVRTPITAIVGLGELLRDSAESAEQQLFIDKLNYSTADLLRIIDDILDFSKIEARKFETHEDFFVIRDLIERIGENLAPAANEKGLNFTIEVDPMIPAKLKSDATRVKQILTNLINNAIKYTDEGTVQILLKAEAVQDLDVLNISYTISDTGIGISKEDQLQLFEPFTQFDHSKLRKKSGTGLGLAIVSRLTELLNGSIEVTSTVGRGSSFRVILPHVVEVPRTLIKYVEPSEMKIITILDDCPRLQTLQAWIDPLNCELIVVPPSPDTLTTIKHLLDEASTTACATHVLYWPFQLSMALRAALEKEFLDLPARDSVWHIIEYYSITDSFSVVHPRVLNLSGSPLMTDHLIYALAKAQGLCAPASPENSSSQEPQRKMPVDNPSAWILLVEDNPTTLEILHYHLIRLGYEVLDAGNGHEAIQIMENESVDLVLTDLQMPEMDGYGLVNHIRKTMKKPQECFPVIALTAHALPQEREQCLQQGFNDCVTKPIRRAQLSDLLKKWLLNTSPLEKRNVLLSQKSFIPSSVFNVKFLIEEFDGDTETIHSLLNSFYNTSHQILQKLQKTCSLQESTTEVEAQMHMLTSAARSIGATRVGQLCLRIRELATSGDWAELRLMVGILHEALEQFHAAAKTWQTHRVSSKMTNPNV